MNEMGCLDCGSVFDNEEQHDHCPICNSTDLVTFQEALENMMLTRSFFEQLGLEESY